MADSVYRVEYHLSLEDGARHRVVIELDAETLALRAPPRDGLPEWTLLDAQKCDHCPLTSGPEARCPLAVSLVDVARLCTDLASIEAMDVQVVKPERTISARTTTQRGIAALMGLVIPASGCPHTAYFRPMARFHLPLATEEETIYRATSMYLLAQYFRAQEGGTPDLALEGLLEIYERMHTVNMNIASRLREAVEKDSSLNALVLLNLFSKALPDTIEYSLDEIRYLFRPYLARG